MPTAPPALVTTTWVTAHLHDPAVALVEVDEDVRAYERGHLPGAVGLDWRADLQDRVRRRPVDRDAFEALMGRHGIAAATHVVLYGGNNNWFAAYAYWLLKLYGHARLSLMDGGRRLWTLEDRPLTTEPSARTPVRYEAAGPNPAIRARRDEMIGRYAGAPSGTALVDVRSPVEYAGEVVAPPHLPGEAAQVAGHVPGAVNVPWGGTVLADTGRFRPVEELRALYGAQGVTREKDVVTYCRIGERSAHTWFVLHELLGFPHVRNYDGSWTEYGSLVDVPVERGT